MAGINLDSGDYLFRNITKTKQGEKISEQGFLIAGFSQNGFLPVPGHRVGPLCPEFLFGFLSFLILVPAHIDTHQRRYDMVTSLKELNVCGM